MSNFIKLPVGWVNADHIVLITGRYDALNHHHFTQVILDVKGKDGEPKTVRFDGEAEKLIEMILEKECE